MTAPLLSVRALRVRYGALRAVDGVSFAIADGEALALVGESGCGKTSVGRAALRLVEAEAGEVWLNTDGGAVDLLALRERALVPLRRQVQIVFQDPHASLNPRHSVRRIVGVGQAANPLVRGAALQDRVARTLARVGLSADVLDRRPHEFSGGQRQRIALARALAMEPRLIVLDEATSALDVSVRGELVNLLAELRRDLGLSLLFISHDLSVVRHLCDRVAVMYLGRIVEEGAVSDVLDEPRHPYTRGLLDALPVPDPTAIRRPAPLVGEPPSPSDPPTGCHFHPRCPLAEERCRREPPPSVEVAGARRVECHLVAGSSTA